MGLNKIPEAKQNLPNYKHYKTLLCPGYIKKFWDFSWLSHHQKGSIYGLQDLLDETLGSGELGPHQEFTSEAGQERWIVWERRGHSLSLGVRCISMNWTNKTWLKYSNKKTDVVHPEYLDIPSKISKSHCIRTKEKVFWGGGVKQTNELAGRAQNLAGRLPN